MNAEDIEIPLLFLVSALSLELLSSWEGFIVTGIVGLYGLFRLVKMLRSWNYDKEKRLEEKRLFEQAQEKHQLEMTILRKQLGEEPNSSEKED